MRRSNDCGIHVSSNFSAAYRSLHSLKHETYHRSTLVPEYITTWFNDLNSSNKDSNQSPIDISTIWESSSMPPYDHTHVFWKTRYSCLTHTHSATYRTCILDSMSSTQESTPHRTSKPDCNLISPMHCNQNFDSVQGTSTSRIDQHRPRHENQAPVPQYLPSRCT